MKIKNNIYTVELSKVYSVFNVLDDQPCDLIKLHGVFFDTFEQFSKGHFIDGILTAIFVDSDYPFVTDTRAPAERFRYFVKKKDLEFTPTPVSPQIYRPFKNTKEFLEFILCDNRDWEGYSFGIRRKSDKKEFDICICGRNAREETGLGSLLRLCGANTQL